MKKSLFLLILGSLLSGCTRESEQASTNAALYGYVSDKVTGTPVAAAQVALKLYDAKTHSISEICEVCGIAQGTLYNAIRKRKERMLEHGED